MNAPQHPAIGAWRIDLFPDGQPSVNHALAACLPGGIVISVPPPVEPFPLTEDGAINVATCLGAWAEDGEHGIELGFLGQATTSTSALVGFGSVHATGRVDEDGDTFSGRYHFEMAGPDETVFATEDGSVRGVRITASSPGRARYLPALATSQSR